MLEVPCVVTATNTNHFQLMQGGELQTVPFPSLPYEWKEGEDVDAQEMFIVGVGRRKVGKKVYGRIPVERVGAGRGERVKHDFITQVILDDPEFFRKHSNKKDPFPLFLDIETSGTAGHKPNPKRDEIISAQLKYRGGESIILETTSQYSEKQLLEELMEYIRRDPKTGLYPDYLVGFYINRFDLPFIFERLYYHKIGSLSSKIGRIHEIGHKVDSYYYPTVLDPMRRIGENICSISTGIYGFDLSLQVRGDVTLAYLPRKGLKQVVAHYGFTPFDVPDWAKQDMETFRKKYPDKFHRYILSDIESTEYLYNIYEPALVASSNMLLLPIIMAQRSSHGFRSTIALYRKARSYGFIGLQQNAERYAHLYARAQKYQGALVGCTRKGYFDKTVYVDCKSMYPNIMHDFNISPDRYEFRGTIDYTGDEREEHIAMGLSMKEVVVEPLDDGRKRVLIPDDNYGAYLEFYCDFEHDGYIRELISELNAKRDAFKKQAKEYYNMYLKSGKTDMNAYSQYLIYNSYQNEAKIINNTIYGIQGDRTNRNGDLPAAVFVTAIGRWIMASMIKYFGDSVLEVDTDGLLLDRSKVSVSIDKVNEHLRAMMSEKFGIPLEKMRFMLEFEGEGSIYLYKAKNYILRKDEDNSLTVKGSSFKGYDKAKVIRDAVSTLSNAIMYKTKSYEEAVKEALDVYKKPLEDFKFTKTIRKPLESYKDFTSAHSILYGFQREGKKQAEIVRELKGRLLAWAEKAVSSPKRRSEITRAVRAAKTEEELTAIATYFTDSSHGKNIINFPILLQIAIEMLQRGREVEIDDTFEFYWTRTPKRYTLAEDMNESIMLDYERYMKEINRAIERFKYADPNYNTFSLFGDVEDTPEFYISQGNGDEQDDMEEEE